MCISGMSDTLTKEKAVSTDSTTEVNCDYFYDDLVVIPPPRVG